MWQWYEGTFIKIINITEHVKRFFIRVDDENTFDFTPGQFITLDLPISEKRLKRWRSYSIANIPNKENLIELVVVRLDGGLGTEYLFEHIDVGDKIKFKGPSGSFVLPETLDKDIVMICTGTGVAPFRSMIKHIYENEIPHEKIHLIFGCRTKKDILYYEEFCALSQKESSFNYSVSLSKEKNWVGYRGYVHQIYMNKYTKPRKNVLFYLCGWTKMVDEAVENLILELEYDKSQVRYELYG